MEAQYYTPTIEEFHVNFEYEFKSSDDDSEEWQPAVIKDGTQIDDITREHKGVKVYNLRVKSLCRQDIEECGWKHNEMNYFNIGNFWLMWIDGKVKIWLEGVNNGSKVQATFFWGTIRNKSELRKIMQQCGISA